MTLTSQNPAATQPRFVFARYFACLFVLGALWMAMSIPAHATDSIGTASATTETCPPGGAANGTCFKVVISGCSGGSFLAQAKLNTPTGTPIGAVILTTGKDGNSWYDLDFQVPNNCNGNCGLKTITDLNAAGYDTIQTNFSDPANTEFAGWLTGSTTTVIGPRLLACRYATLANWVWTSLLQSDTTRPTCATGNSAGSAAIAYSISQYGLGSSTGPGPDFRMVELTSGPPLSRIDHGCTKNASKPTVTCPSGTQISENIGLTNAGEVIDPAYDGDWDCNANNVCTPDGSLDLCEDAIQNGTTPDPRLHHDSILSDTDSPTLSYNTYASFVFGAQDLESAVPLGLEYYNAITSTKSQSCVGTTQSPVMHNLPGYTLGEAQIITDIKAHCK